MPAPPDVAVPVVGISLPRASARPTRPTRPRPVHVDANSDPRESTNVLADTPTGNPTTTIVGSHLVLVPEGPGITTTAPARRSTSSWPIQMAKHNRAGQPRALRLVGAEESGLVGATRYVAAIPTWRSARANLNFDMLALPNHANLVYDGDFADSPPPATAPDENRAPRHRGQLVPGYFVSAGAASSRPRSTAAATTSPSRTMASRRRPVLRAEVVQDRGAGRQVGRQVGLFVPLLPPGLRRHQQPRHQRPRDGDLAPT